MLCHATTVSVDRGAVSCAIVAPSLGALPPDTLGYVRSRRRAARSPRHHGQRLPFRDYDAGALADSRALIPSPRQENVLCVGLRNSVNETLYRLRHGGRWFKQADEPEGAVDPGWPALAVGKDGRLRLLPFAEAVAIDGDVATGLPLVVGGKPLGRAFFVAHCSDVSWNYDCDPNGVVGPRPAERSVQAWEALSERWQELRESDTSRMESELDRIATDFGCAPATKLHAGFAQRGDTFAVWAISGELERIARHLAAEYDWAFCTENGGSIGWMWYAAGSAAPVQLVGGSNWRAPGLAFLAVKLAGPLLTGAHPVLK